MALPSASNMGQLRINPSGTAPSATETLMRCPAWWLLDMSPLEFGMPDERGESILIPHANGRTPVPSYLDETVYVMPLYVTGECDASGVAPTGSALTQLKANRTRLLQNVAGPYDGTTTRRLAKLTFTDGTSVLFYVKCRFELTRQKGAQAWYVFDLRVPAGLIF